MKEKEKQEILDLRKRFFSSLSQKDQDAFLALGDILWKYDTWNSMLPEQKQDRKYVYKTYQRLLEIALDFRCRKKLGLQNWR